MSFEISKRPVTHQGQNMLMDVEFNGRLDGLVNITIQTENELSSETFTFGVCDYGVEYRMALKSHFNWARKNKNEPMALSPLAARKEDIPQFILDAALSVYINGIKSSLKFKN